MIGDAVSFNVDETDLINLKKSDADFSSVSWEDLDLKVIKAKIKSFYIGVQNNICSYCQQKIKSNHGRYWDTEHIIPRAHQKNFMFEPKNLCVACIDCNSRKSDKKVTSSKAEIRLPLKSDSYFIVHPHLDSYDDHIMIIKEGFYYVAIRPKGEKTIDICGLNRFYEYADYNDNEDDRMLMLCDELSNTENKERKKALRNKIAYLAIKGNLSK